MKVKKKVKKSWTPAVVIENCTLNGGASAAQDALARAIEANANAVLELSKSMTRPNSLIYVGNKSDDVA